MNEVSLNANYKGPRAQLTTAGATFYWDAISRRYPRKRYALKYEPKGRTFTLTRYMRFSLSSREMKKQVLDPKIVAIFRAALSSEHIAHMTRVSMGQGLEVAGFSLTLDGADVPATLTSITLPRAP